MSPVHGKFAVALNRNAKKVTEKVAEISGELVQPEDLFLSESGEDAERIARIVVDRQYETVFAGGGDGTVMHLINQLAQYPLERQPAIGILKLGTGNAMARMVSSGNLAGDLQTYIRTGTRDHVPLSLVEVEGQRCPFVGLGWDAEILNDYKAVKDTWGRSAVLKPVVQTVGGYFLSFFARTTPRLVKKKVSRQKANVRAVAGPGLCHQLGADGKILGEFQEGDVIYNGTANILMAGTIPYYGYGLKVLPYATMDPNRMHLRLTSMSASKALANLPKLWRGEYSDVKMFDFLIESVRLEVDPEVPYQTGGDAAGYRDKVFLKTLPGAVRLLKLL